MGQWKEISHTADVGIEVFGRSLEDLFQTGGEAFAELTTDPKTIKSNKSQKIRINEDDLEFLFKEFFDELLFLLETKDFIATKFSGWKIVPGKGLQVTARGGIWDVDKHESRTEIKQTTYHMLKVEQINDDLWRGKVLFDV
jgi:SHS2 domain-containing protein